MTRINGKTAFVFTGGGSLGAIQVGMSRVLLTSGVLPDFVVGSSVGALNAATSCCTAYVCFWPKADIPTWRFCSPVKTSLC